MGFTLEESSKMFIWTTSHVSSGCGVESTAHVEFEVFSILSDEIDGS